MALCLPKIAPVVLERGRVAAWLTSHAKTSLRYLCAPAGSGKTTAAVLYARSRSDRVAFISLEPGCEAPALRAAFCESLGVSTARTYREMVAGLGGVAPLEIIVDNIDNAAADARDVLGRIFLDAPEGVVFIYLGAADETLSIGSARARGFIDTCDAGFLAFEPDEVESLAALFGVREDSLAAAQLCEATHGWAIAIGGACRTAGETALPLPGALREWRSRNEAALHKLAGDALGAAPPRIASAFADVVEGRVVADADLLTAFARLGLFVVNWNSRLRLNPLLATGANPSSALLRYAPPAVIETFGRFAMSIGARQIAWIRPRDGQIIAFLATRPHGRATRAEIIAVFWPETDRQLAGQSLRTACSTIRRALSAYVGRANVEQYFIGGEVLELILENAVVSSLVFKAQCELAASAYARGDYAKCFAHARTARTLYRAPFLAGEAPSEWALAYARELALLNAEVERRADDFGLSRVSVA